MATVLNPGAAPVQPLPAPALPLRRILCPLDFSELSARAVDRAAQLACASGAEIRAPFVAPVGDAQDGTFDAGARTTVAGDAEWFLHPHRAVGVKVSFSQAAGDAAALSRFRRARQRTTTTRVLSAAPAPVRFAK